MRLIWPPKSLKKLHKFSKNPQKSPKNLSSATLLVPNLVFFISLESIERKAQFSLFEHLISDGATNKELEQALLTMRKEIDILKANAPRRPGSTGLCKKPWLDCVKTAFSSVASSCNLADISLHNPVQEFTIPSMKKATSSET